MIVFGYLAPNRRIDVVIDVLASMPEADRFSLDIYGELANRSAVEDQISRLGLETSVKIRGFVPETELDCALASSDLAINLRFPTMGEASGSQLRCWANALPSIVSKVGWYATLPENAVGFVRPEFEREDLTFHLRNILQDRGKYERMGELGRKQLMDAHSPEQYAETLVNIAKHASSLRVRTAALKWADRTANRLGELGDIIAAGQMPRRAAMQLSTLSVGTETDG